MHNLVSLVIPVYDGHEYFEEALRSVQVQTHNNLEILFVVEMGADPRIIDIIESRSDPRFRMLHNGTKLGLPASLNKGIAAATGEFVARMDGDDISLPHRIETQVAYLAAHPDVDFCGTFCRLFGDEQWDFEPSRTHEGIRVDLLLGCPFVHPSVMFRRQRFIDENLAYNESLGATEDYDLWSRCGEVLCLANVDEILLEYRKHAGAATARHRELGERVYRDVMLKQLQKLLTVSAAEIDVHFRFFTSGVSDIQSFARACRWFERLADANDLRDIYNKDLLRATLAWRLFESAERLGKAPYYGIVAASRLRPMLDEVRLGALLNRIVSNKI